MGMGMVFGDGNEADNGDGDVDENEVVVEME